MKKRSLILGLACVASLLFACATTQAQIITNSYAAKFVCGVQWRASINAVANAQLGRYSTTISIYNNTGSTINYSRKIIQFRDPKHLGNHVFIENSSLGWGLAHKFSCEDVYKDLKITGLQPPPYIEGFMIIEPHFGLFEHAGLKDPFDVVGVYTYRGDVPDNLGRVPNYGVSISVVTYPAKDNIHRMQ